MGDKAMICAGAAAGLGGVLLAEGLIAGFGAATGAIGWGVVHNAAGWTVPKFGYTKFVQACTAGNMVIGNIGLCFGSSTAKSKNNTANNTDSDSATANKQNGIVALAWLGFSGACTGMLGAQMLGLLSSGAEVGFAAAAGATGSAIAALSLAGVAVAVTCVGGMAYVCCSDEFGDVKLVKVPKENFDARGNIKTLENATIHNPEEVFKDPQYHTMQGISAAMEKQLKIKVEMPKDYTIDSADFSGSANKQNEASGCLSRAMARLGF